MRQTTTQVIEIKKTSLPVEDNRQAADGPFVPSDGAFSYCCDPFLKVPSLKSRLMTGAFFLMH